MRASAFPTFCQMEMWIQQGQSSLGPGGVKTEPGKRSGDQKTVALVTVAGSRTVAADGVRRAAVIPEAELKVAKK